MLGDSAGALFVGHGIELVARAGNARKTENLHWHRRTGFLHGLATVVHHRADTTSVLTSDDVVTDAQRAFLHEDGSHRAATLVELGLNDSAFGAAVGGGLEVGDFGDEQHGLEQLVDVHAGLGRHRQHDRVAAPLFRHEPILGELLHDALGLGAGLVGLVEGHDDRHLGGLGVSQRFHRLRHHAVV